MPAKNLMGQPLAFALQDDEIADKGLPGHGRIAVRRDWSDKAKRFGGKGIVFAELKGEQGRTR